MRLRTAAAAVVTTLLTAAAAARAADPFVYTVTTTSGTPTTVRIRGDNLVRVTDELILGYGRAGRAVAGRDVTAVLNYAGVRNALRLDLSGDRTTASLRYNLTGGPTDTFNGSGAGNPARVVDDQVYDTLTDPHHREIENLQQALNRQSYVMPLDGNPSAATAFLADQTFAKFGLARVGQPPGFADRPQRPVRFDEYGRPYTEDDDDDRTVPYGGRPLAQLYQPVFWFDASGDSIRTNGFNGVDARFSFNAMGHFAPGVGWAVSVPVQYRTVDGAESDTVAVNFGLPIEIVTADRDQPFSWTVTPFVEFAVNDSQDLGSTQAVFDGGVASRLAVQFGPDRRWTLALANQFTGFVGLGPVREDDGDYDGYDSPAFRGHVAQQLFKTGVQVARRFDYGLSADVSVTYSTFVANAATDQWWSPRVGAAWQFSPNFCVRVAYEADLANRYQSQGGQFQIDYKY